MFWPPPRPSARSSLSALAQRGIARRRLRYETWYFVHLYTYLAIALSFSHQLATGNEFTTHPANRVLWVGLYLVTFGSLLVYRVAVPVRDAFRYQLRVSSIQPEGPDAVSVYVTGRHLDRMPVEAGQFFRWRFLDRRSWWEAHPFSLSAMPDSQVLRITAKGVGDHSRALRHVEPGTRVMAEGPYGNLTARLRTRRRVLLIAGGVGITPLRALFEALPGAPGDITLLYRVRVERELLFAPSSRSWPGRGESRFATCSAAGTSGPVRSAAATCGSTCPTSWTATSFCAGRLG